jgi:hypothetical protein
MMMAVVMIMGKKDTSEQFALIIKASNILLLLLPLYPLIYLGS